MLCFIICVALALFCEYLCSQLPEGRVDVLTALAIILPASEVCKQIILYRQNGFYDWWYFPFQLCSLIMYLLPVRQMCKSRRLNKYIDTFLIDFGLVGGVAVFMDQSGMQYNRAVLTVHSYLWHTAMIFVAIHLARRVKGLHFAKGVAVYLAGVVLTTAINTVFRGRGLINMFYISPYLDMAQLLFKDIARLTTQTVAKVLYVLATIAAAYTVDTVVKNMPKISDA